MDHKKHLTVEGLQQIVNLRAAINLGLSDELKAAFPNIISVKRPLVKSQNDHRLILISRIRFR